MSLLELPESTRRRLPAIKLGLIEGKTSEEIAAQFDVRRETIERDKRKWRQSGAFEDWLKEEWIRLHYIIQEEEPTEAYRQLTRLLGKTLVRRMELKAEVKERVEIELDVTDAEDEILSRAAAILERKTKPHKIH